VQVNPLSDADLTAWDLFVNAHPEGSFFHLTGWKRVLERAFGHKTHYLIAKDSLGVQGVLPLARVKSLLFGDSLVSTPFCVYGGPVAATLEARAALEAAACDLARELDVDFLELRNRKPSGNGWPTKDLYVTFRKAIVADDQANLAAIPRKQRAIVRKGIEAGLETTLDTDARRLYDAYSESLRNLGTPVFSRRYLEILREEFGDRCEIETISTGGNVLASVMSFYFRDEVLPYYGGGTSLARQHSANDYMYWQLMKRAAARGVRIFDYGRSKRDTGAFKFKTHWGFEPEPLSYEYFLVRAKSMPNLSPTNPRYSSAINLWKKMPLRLTQMIGPPVARYLG
jgi:FemAB-related protein (PEP-CTERM system-associated)